MALRDARYTEVPLLCVLDGRNRDLLLEKLRKAHGTAGRADIAPEITTATRATARLFHREQLDRPRPASRCRERGVPPMPGASDTTKHTPDRP
jgi:hypothetical protein